MANVFISYAATDHDTAERVYEHLTGAGVRCWLDNIEVQPEADWLQQVEQAVKSASHGLLLLSPAAVRSPMAMGEFHDLLLEDKPVYIALIAEVPANDLPFHLQNVPLFDLAHDFQGSLEEITQALLADGDPLATDPQQRDVTITLQANLRDLDTDKFVDLVDRLAEIGIKDIKVINVSTG